MLGTIEGLRVVNGGQMLRIASNAKRAGFNRQLDSETLRNFEGGFAVLRCAMVHDHAGGKRTDAHVRAHAMIPQGRDENDKLLSVEVLVDVSMEDWQSLKTIPAETIKRLRGQITA